MTDGHETSYISDLKADNRRLRRLLDERDAPGELRHRLRSTLAILRVVIRKTAETGRDLPAYVAHLEDRLDAIGRAQAAVDEAGGIKLHDLLSEEFLHYGAHEGVSVALSGPQILLRPRAGQVMALAVHELAVNAVEHGALGLPEGRIHVEWTVAPGADVPILSLIWKESGSTQPCEKQVDGFGMEVLTRTLAYELHAEADLVFEPDGLLFALKFPLTDGFGEIEPG